MAVMDEFREERAALKNADFKKKWQYFLDYYKWYVIGGAAALISIISFIYSAVTAKDSAFGGYFINTYSDPYVNERFTQTFAETAGIDLNEYSILIDTSLQYNASTPDESTMATQQKIMVTLAAQEIDFIAADEETFLHYATTDTFHDLRNIYTEAELAAFAEYIYYVDGEVIRQREAAYDNGLVEEYVEPVYNHFAPEEMTNPIPIALCIQDCPTFKDTIYFKKGYSLLGFVANSLRIDTTKVFVDYIFEGLMK